MSSTENPENNRQKTKANDIVSQAGTSMLEPLSYNSRSTPQHARQINIPVIDLTQDTPSQNNQRHLEMHQNDSLYRNQSIDIIDVENLPERRHSSRHLEYFQQFPFEPFVDLDDILLWRHSLPQQPVNNCIHSAMPSRRITRQMTNQRHQWENQIIQTGNNFLHALINHMTPSNRRRTNVSTRRTASYPYYISSYYDFPATSLEYNLFPDQTDDFFSQKDTPLVLSQYKKPPEAMEGFTRSLSKDQKLVCPSCIHELGASVDIVKKTIWIGKCGHVYCGTCAALFRSMKSKGQHSALCVVKHCNKVITGKYNLREIYV